MKKSLLIFFIFFIYFLPIMVGCSAAKNSSNGNKVQKKAIPAQTQLVLGTVCSVNLYDQGTAAVYKRLFERLHDIEAKMSANLADSEIVRVNKAAGNRAVQVSDDTFGLLEQSLYFAEKTGGAFDPTVGPLSKLWNIGFDTARVPTDAEIAAVLPLIDYRQLELNPAEKTAFLKKKGMKIDLGGIAKGYAADELVAILKEEKITSALIDLGGNIYVHGKKTDGTLWRVGIKDPDDPTGLPAARIETANDSIVTSGVYERYIEQNGVRYHHILDIATGKPVQNGVTSFTILCESSAVADALSTSCFLLGEKEGIAFANKIEGVEAACITEDGIIRATPLMGKKLTVLRPEFVLKTATQ